MTVATKAATRVAGWFRHDVEDRLAEVVGGPARLRVITLLACVLGLQTADTSTVGAIGTPLEQALHLTNTDLGLLVTVATGIGAIATLPVGVLVDRIHRIRLLAAAIAAWSAASVVSGLSTSFGMLLGTRLALGAVVAVAGPTVTSLTGDLFHPAERGRIFGYILTGELVGAGFGYLVSGNVAAALSWRWAFIVLAVPGFVLAAALLRLLPEPARGGQSRLSVGATDIPSAEDVTTSGDQVAGDEPPADDDSPVVEQVERAHVRPHERLVLHTDPAGMSLWAAVRYVLALRTNQVLIAASAVGYFFLSGLQTFAVEFLRGRFGLGQSVGTTLLAGIGVGAIVGVLITGRVADRLADRGHLSARPVVAGLAFLVTALLFLPGLLLGSLLAAFPLLFLAAAAYGGTNPPLDAARLDVMQHRLWGRAESVRTVLRSAFQAIAPITFGALSGVFGGTGGGFGTAAAGGTSAAGTRGLDLTFIVMLAPLVAAGLLLVFAARRSYPRDVATAVASEAATASSATAASNASAGGVTRPAPT